MFNTCTIGQMIEKINLEHTVDLDQTTTPHQTPNHPAAGRYWLGEISSDWFVEYNIEHDGTLSLLQANSPPCDASELIESQAAFDSALTHLLNQFESSL